MGKSVKKTPINKDNNSSKKEQKRRANKAVRRKLKDLDYTISNGRSYQKEFESYNIADYVCRWTKEEAIQDYENRCRLEFYTYSHLSPEFSQKLLDDFLAQYPTLDDYLRYWEKCMKRK